MMADGSFERMAEFDAKHRAEMGQVSFKPGMRVRTKRNGQDGIITKIDVKGQIWFRGDCHPMDYCTLEDRTTLLVINTPPLKGRAGDLAKAMVSVRSIGPVLSSRYLVKGWLDRGAFSVVYGESNVGKTFFALDLAMHVAAAQDWHGNRIPGAANYAGRVVYVACEGGTGILNRVDALRKHRPQLFDAMEGEDFTLLPTTLDLCGPSDASALGEAIEVFCPDPALIVIDTLAMAFGGGDENTAKDMGLFVANCGYLRASTGAHVMVIHHSGKDSSKGARGSGSLRAAADTEIELTRRGEVIFVEQRKQRDMSSEKSFAYTLMGVFLGQDEDGDAVTSAVVEPTEAPTKRAPRLSGQALIAMQAFGDALAVHGEVKHGQDYPDNRHCLSLDHWREACDRHSLSSGDGESSKRAAFHKNWKALQEKGLVLVIDGFAWRCADE